MAQSSTNSTDSGVECTDQRLALECSTGSALDCTALEKNGQQSNGGSIQDPHEITVLELLSNTCDSDINTKVCYSYHQVVKCYTLAVPRGSRFSLGLTFSIVVVIV